MSHEENPSQNQNQEQNEERQRKLRVAEISFGQAAVEITASRVPIADFGPYKVDHIQSFGGLGIDAYADFVSE
jgi:hypothetical protein